VQANQAFRVARREAGMSQREAADAIGINSVTLCRWESGQTQPIVDYLVKMGEIYKVSLDQLCGVKPF
jgi:DNA-binding XRE family transcriptional regulator